MPKAARPGAAASPARKGGNGSAARPADSAASSGKPLAGKALAGKSLAGKPFAGKPPAGKPIAGKPPAANSAAAAPRKWPKGGPTKAEMRAYRTRLLEMRSQLMSSSRDLAKEALQSAGGEFSVDHMADHGSDNFEQDFNLKLLEGEAGQLEDIRDALAKVDGTHELPFGLCEACADHPQGLCPSCPWIPASRLEVLPHARLCVQTKASEEQARG